MPGVSVDGMIHQLFQDEANERQDMFQFFRPTNAEGPDVTEFDIVAQAQDNDRTDEQPAEVVWEFHPVFIEALAFDDFSG